MLMLRGDLVGFCRVEINGLVYVITLIMCCSTTDIPDVNLLLLLCSMY